MQYIRNSTLLPCSTADLRLAISVLHCELPENRLILYDESISNFWFEFEPQRDIELFLQHAHFGCMSKGRLLIGREDLLSVALLPEVAPSTLTIPSSGEALPPLGFEVDWPALEEARSANEWAGQVSIYSCGIAGCYSQYAWFQHGKCLALFTIGGTSLVSVDWRPFRLGS